MKTPEEIKKGLECCGTGDFGNHKDCPYDIAEPKCMQNLLADALAYIQQLEAQVKEMKHTLDVVSNHSCAINEAAVYAVQQMARERDAAVADIHKTCSTCKHYYYNRQDDDTADCLWFDGCKSGDHWEWRGVQEPPKEE